MTLHQWQYHNSAAANRTQEMAQSKMAIESMTAIMVETVRDFLPRIYSGWKKSHHPQGIQSVFMAADALVDAQQIGTNRECLEQLKEMLRVQSKRWRIAGKTPLNYNV